jgi:hypothetical protein
MGGCGLQVMGRGWMIWIMDYRRRRDWCCGDNDIKIAFFLIFGDKNW